MIVIFDGPEKAGKSTLIDGVHRELHRLGIDSTVRKWGPVSPDDRVYLPYVKSDAVSDTVVLWDRSWCSEYAYATLLKRDRRLKDDPWLGEWLYGRASAIKYMLLPETVQNIQLRDSSDLPVSPLEEIKIFFKYADDYGWHKLYNTYTLSDLSVNIWRVVNDVKNLKDYVNPFFNPPKCVGLPISPVIFIGEKRNESGSYPGGWLPFTSPNTMKYGRLLGSKAMVYVWTNVGDVDAKEVVKSKIIITCGKKAYRWANKIGVNTVIALPHPSWLYRFNSPEIQMARRTVERMLKIIGEYDV